MSKSSVIVAVASVIVVTTAIVFWVRKNSIPLSVANKNTYATTPTQTGPYVKVSPYDQGVRTMDIICFYSNVENSAACHLHWVESDAEWRSLEKAGARLAQLSDVEHLKSRLRVTPLLIADDNGNQRFWAKRDRFREEWYLLPGDLEQPTAFWAAIDAKTMPPIELNVVPD